MYQDADGTKLGVPLLEVIEMRRNAKNIVSWIPCSILLCVNASSGQELNVLNREYIPKEWKSTWVSNPDHSGNEYAVVLFRNTLDLPEVPIYPHPLGQFILTLRKQQLVSLVLSKFRKPLSARWWQRVKPLC